MSRNRQARKSAAPAVGKDAQTELVLDLDRYIPALITFIARALLTQDEHAQCRTSASVEQTRLLIHFSPDSFFCTPVQYR